MLNKVVIDRIRWLRHRGSSYKSISSRILVSVGSVYTYSKDISLTKTQKRKLLLNTAVGASRLNKEKWGKKGGLLTKNRSKYTKLDLIRLTQSFYRKKGRIPLKENLINIGKRSELNLENGTYW